MPVGEVKLIGHRDEPVVVVEMKCPTCGACRKYYPTESEVQKYYENRYSDNIPMLIALGTKLSRVWNWR
jgi:thiol-disulfide isomerase/thioredoxin